jgi:hypothetical protein
VNMYGLNFDYLLCHLPSNVKLNRSSYLLSNLGVWHHISYSDFPGFWNSFDGGMHMFESF